MIRKPCDTQVRLLSRRQIFIHCLKIECMRKLITAKEAKVLVAGSEERKQELIRLVNAEISSQAERGLCWSHFPNSTNEIERQFLAGLLVENGFKVIEGNPAISW
jgi:hypothetical protein